MAASRGTFVYSLDSSGAGTATTVRPISGIFTEFRLPTAATALTGTGSTCDFTVTRQTDGGTVFTVSNISAPVQYAVGRKLVYFDGAGTTAYATGVGPVTAPGVPVNDYLVCTVAQGAPSAAGTVYFHYER